MELAIDKNKKISAENKAKIEGNLNAKIEAITDPSSKKYFSFFFKDLLFLLGKNQKKITTFRPIKSAAKLGGTLSDANALRIISFIVKFPELAKFQDDDFDAQELNFENENLAQLKELVIEAIENNEENYLETLENSDFNQDILKIKNYSTELEDKTFDWALIRFRKILLEDLLLQVEQQYRESLGKSVEDIGTHQIDQKTREIFNYKKSLELRITSLVKEE
jgi:hypothetical protein